MRTLGDLSAQGAPVNIQARLTRWRCRNDQCDRRIFAGADSGDPDHPFQSIVITDSGDRDHAARLA